MTHKKNKESYIIAIIAFDSTNRYQLLYNKKRWEKRKLDTTEEAYTS